MGFTLDHIVHAVAAPAAAAEVFGDAWGLPVVPGGAHPGMGTANSLCHLGLSYVEFLYIRDAAEAAAHFFGQAAQERLRRGPGPYTLALGTRELDAAAERLRSAGVAVLGPLAGRRQRPDGSLLQWRFAFPGTPPLAGWPFLIEWGEDDAAREADLRRRGVLADGAVHLAWAAVAVPDLAAAVAGYRAALGLVAGPAEHDPLLVARTARIDLDRGALLLCEPAGPGPAAQALDLPGARAFAYALAGAGVPALAQRLGVAPGALVRPAQACGAWVRLLVD